MMNHRFYKWATTLVVATWLSSIGLQEIEIIPTIWALYLTLPGALSGGFAPALWATDNDDDAS